MATCAAAAAGLASCPCLSSSVVSAHMASVTSVDTGTGIFSAFTNGAVYPVGYGVGCERHDLLKPPSCEPEWCAELSGECARRWCSEPWCYVNATACALQQNPNSYIWLNQLPGNGSALSYSYETCNGTDTFAQEHIERTAPSPAPPAEW